MADESSDREKRTGLGAMIGAGGPGMLAGLRVVEVADELGEYCGLLFAGLGADVIKIEPPEGTRTRKIGPFLDDEPHPERSIFFWKAVIACCD
jgi:crotonobetainyl-CoA:carnitine CoA-transferase CaiB-like acyl-CoA transferase